VLPTTTCAQATPFICTVGSASAVTVVGVAADGVGGAESACAEPGARMPSIPTTSRALTAPERKRAGALDHDVIAEIPVPACPRGRPPVYYWE
jgi:hypothetical protein